MKGYMGVITYVDLTAGRVWDEPLTETAARAYIGGSGLGTRILFDQVPKGADPLSPGNALVMATGPVTGTLAHGSGRTCLVTKSPLTGLYMDSSVGGEFGAFLKRSGRDALVILGKAPRPSVLVIDGEKARIESADGIWGLSTKDAQDEVRGRFGQGFSVICCGPAGERLAPIACAIAGRRASGRGGTGAVMGSKNLKAVAVRGTKDVTVSDIKGLLKLHFEMREKFLALAPLRDLGTPFLVSGINKVGGLGTRNWQEETWEHAGEIGGERLKDRHFVRNWACSGCNMGGCTHIVKSLRGEGTLTEGPEYETLFAVGSNCGVSDLNAVIECDRLCDDLGLDTVSFGGTLAFLMECFERGLIGEKETGGLDLRFGNAEALLAATHLAGSGEGVGRLIGMGTRAAAAEIGQGSEKFACHIRGLEPPGHSARALKSMAIGFAISPRGGSHHDTRSGGEYQMDWNQRNSTDGKAKTAFATSDWSAVGDSLIICKFLERPFGGVTMNQLHADLLRMTTGWDVTVAELNGAGHRIHTLKRAFNCREGVRRAEDTLPWRFMQEDIPEGGSKGLRARPEDMAAMLAEYYALRGWDADGVPTRECLDAAGLSDVAI